MFENVLILKKGGIHIKKKNRGKFTEYCGGKVTQECIAKGKKSKDPKIRKRATFAANVRRWKHENGGILKAQNGTGNLYAPHPLSPVGIALNQAKAITKMKGEQRHLPPGVKEVVGPDGKKAAIRTEQPLVPLEQSIAEWLPGTGDVAEVGYIANDIKNGNYGSAALAAAMIALPGNAGKIFRKSDVPTSKLTEAERLGIPKGERSNPKALDDSQYWGYEQWNERYNAAIQSGNKEEVQRLRDLHFKIKAPDTKFVTNDGFPQHNYHGGQKGITVFLNAKDNPNYHQTRHQGYSHPETRSGIYFSEYMDTAKNYKYRRDGEIYDVYLNASRPYKQTYTTTLMNRFKNLNPFQRYFDPAIIRNIDLETTLKDFDSVKHSDAENVVWDGKRIKLANGITYDDSGNIVPIVKRDNFRNVDSRYQQGGKL